VEGLISEGLISEGLLSGIKRTFGNEVQQC